MSIMSKNAPDLSKVEPLNGHNYRRWAQKLLMFFEQYEIDYVLFSDPPAPVNEITDDVTLTPPGISVVKSNAEAIAKHDKDNKTVRFHLLNLMHNTLFDLFMVYKSAKTMWELLEKKYGADDAGKKKYVVGKWLGFQMVDDKPIMDQVHVYENLCADVVNEGMKLDEIFLANVLLEKFPPSWSDYRNHLKHKKKDLSLQELVGHMRTEEANRLKDKPVSQSVKSSNANVDANLVESGGPSYSEKFKGKGKAKFGRGKNQGRAKKNGPGKHSKPVPKIETAKGPFVCYVCGKPGHKAYQCSEKKTTKPMSESMTSFLVVVVEANMWAVKWAVHLTVIAPLISGLWAVHLTVIAPLISGLSTFCFCSTYQWAVKWAVFGSLVDLFL
ncbi:uncharacterized protein LOC141600508 [Silene latifolia]|uniref:uncharacterized protein LOC141600508 n=1 Tax=Silene latifolia TaxID=37657 RepID=UPI003D78039D